MSGNAPFTVQTQSHERRHGRFVIQWTEYQMCNGPLTMNEHEAVEALNRLHQENQRLKDENYKRWDSGKKSELKTCPMCGDTTLPGETHCPGCKHPLGGMG